MSKSDLKVRVADRKTDLSVGRLVDGLQACGIATDDAVDVARATEKDLREQGIKIVDLPDLVERVAAAVSQRVGPEAAERWRRRTPPFVHVMVQHEDGTRVRFSRRRLAVSLEDVGLTFKDAWTFSQHVEQALRSEGIDTVTDAELPGRVATLLEARFGRDARQRYEGSSRVASVLRIRDRDDDTSPYSRGILARSLSALGLEPDVAYAVARTVEYELWNLHRLAGVVDRQTLHDTVTRVLGERTGEEFARRFSLMQRMRRARRPIVVTIGGTAGTGKSEVAAELAYRLGIVRVVSSDSVRQALRSLIGPDLSPILHASSFEAWMADMLPSERDRATPRRKRVIRGFQSQVMQLGTALEAIVDRHMSEGTSLVVEGVHVVPGVRPRPVERGTWVGVVLKVDDPHVHRDRFLLREGRTDARRPRDRYVRHFDEIRMLQDWLVRKADAASVAVVDVTDLDGAVDRVMEHVLDEILLSDEGRTTTGARAEDADMARPAYNPPGGTR